MNITDSGGKWQLTDGMLRNRKSNETRAVTGVPSVAVLAAMSESKFVRQAEIAFETGEWPSGHR